MFMPLNSQCPHLYQVGCIDLIPVKIKANLLSALHPFTAIHMQKRGDTEALALLLINCVISQWGLAGKVTQDLRKEGQLSAPGGSKHGTGHRQEAASCPGTH